MDLQSLLFHFAQNPLLLFFLAAYIGGEELIIPLAVLVGQGLWDVETLFTVCFVATVLADITWFLLGRHGVQRRKFFQKYQHRFEKASTFFRRIAKSEMGILLTTKFIYGTRIFSIIFLSLEGLALPKFILLNSIVTFIWLSCIVTIGWMIGRGSSLFLNIYKHPVYIGLGLITLIVLFHTARHYFAKRFLPELEK
jgi:membrane protein DedA with SNARE-associated domain